MGSTLEGGTDSSDTDFAAVTVASSLAQQGWDRIARTLSGFSYVAVIVWLGAVAFSMAGYSRQKPLWNDELLFRWIATLPTARDIWSALAAGINTDPPLAHLLVHSLTPVFGSTALIVRLPSMAGICTMLLCLFLTLRQQVGPLYGLLGLVVPFCTTLPGFGYEARPYGLMYGCIGLAIYCWARIGDDRFDRISWNAGLALALTATLACHFYSVFVLPAFYFAELVRTQRRRRVSWPTLIALVSASATPLLYWPIIADARKFSVAYFDKPRPGSLLDMLSESLPSLALPLFAFLLLAAIFIILGFRFARHSADSDRSRELTALALGFLLIPVLGLGAGIVYLKAFHSRYVLHGLIGVFLMVPLFAARIFKLDRSLGLALLVAFGLPASIYVVRGAAGTGSFQQANKDMKSFAALEAALPGLDGDIVVSNPLDFTQIVSYSPALKARCILLLDSGYEFRYTGQNGTSLIFASAAHRDWFRAEQWSDYPDRNKAFLFLTVPDDLPEDPGWLRAHLNATGRYGDVVTKFGRFLLVRAKPPQP